MGVLEGVNSTSKIQSLMVEKRRANYLIVNVMQSNIKLGSLYDRRTDRVVDALQLWNDKTLTNRINAEQIDSQQYSINSDPSLLSKMRQLDIDNGLGLSFCCGMLNIDGSAQYINDNQESSDVAKVALLYSETTIYKEIISDTFQKVDFVEVLESKTKQETFTHFVAGILFGCNCNIVFEEKIRNNTLKNEQVHLMSSILNQIAFCGKIDPSLNSAINYSNKICCKIYSDVKLNENVSTWGEAITMCGSLQSKLFSELWEDTCSVSIGVPIKLFLLPKQVINSNFNLITYSPIITRDVSEILSNQVKNIIETLNMAINMSSDLKKNQEKSKFDGFSIFGKIDFFIDYVKTYNKCFQKVIKEIVLNIRTEKIEEQALTDIINDHNVSIFSESALLNWIECAAQEVQFFENYTKRLSSYSIEFLSRDFELSDLKHEVAIVLKMKPQEIIEKYLNSMKIYIEMFRTATKTDAYFIINMQDIIDNINKICFGKGYKSELVLNMEDLIELAEANVNNKNLSYYIIETSLSCKKPQTVLQVWIKDNNTLDNFDSPSSVQDFNVTMVSHEKVDLNWKMPTKGYLNISSFLVKVYKFSNIKEVSTNETDCITIEINDLPDDGNISCAINNLECGCKYIASVVCTSIKKLAKSKEKQVEFKTRLCSAPLNVTYGLMSQRKVLLSWLPPIVIMNGVIQCYLIEYKTDNHDDIWKTIIIDSADLKCKVKNLFYSKSYKFRISTCLVNSESSLFHEFSVATEGMPCPQPYKAIFKKNKLIVKWRNDEKKSKEKLNYVLRYRVESEISQWTKLSPNNICKKEMSNDYRVKIMMENPPAVCFVVQIMSYSEFGNSKWSQSISCYNKKDNFPDDDEDDEKYFNIEDQINKEDIKIALQRKETIFETDSLHIASCKQIGILRWMKSIEMGDYQCLNKKIQWIDETGKHKGVYHPMDLLYYLIKNSDNSIRRKLYRKLFACKISVPVLLHKKKTLYMDFSLSKIELMWIKNSDQTVEINASHANLPVVSLLRIGKQGKSSISKSKLGNDLLKIKFESGLGGCGYFTRESLSSNYLRKASSGIVEALWFQKTTYEEKFSTSFCMLNLRGDALHYFENASILVNASDVVLFLCDAEMFEDNRYKELLANMARQIKESSRKLKVIVLMTKKAYSKVKENRETFESLSEKICWIEIYKEPFKLLKLLQSEINKSLDEIQKPSSLNKRFKSLKKESLSENNFRALEISELLLKKMSKIQDSDDTLGYKIRESLFPHQSIVKLYAQKQREETRSIDLKKKYLIQSELSDIKSSQYRLICNGLSNVTQKFITNLIDCDDLSKLNYVYLVQDKLDIWCKENISAMTNILTKFNKKLNYLKENINKQEYIDNRDIHLSETEHIKSLYESQKKKILNVSIGIENLFREVGLIFETVSRYEKEKDLPIELLTSSKKLPELAALLLLKGFAIEIMDGDGLNVPVNWLCSVFNALQKRFKSYFEINHEPNIFVLTVLGTQSTGKSTLLNTMFGLEYPVGSGRCTKGVFLQLVPLTIKNCSIDALFVIDTEGLGAPEYYGSNMHDNEIATFVLGISNLTIINVMGELPTNVENFLQISTCALMRMNMVDIHPSCIFVHQNCGSSSKDKNCDSRVAFLQMMDEAVINQAKLNNSKDRYKCFQNIVNVSFENFFYFPQFLDSSSAMATMSSEYVSACKNLKEFIIEKFLLKNKVTQTFDDFSKKLQLIWSGVIEENFVLSLLNSAEVQIKHEVDSELSDWKSNMEKHLNSCTEIYCNEISAFFKNKQNKNEKLEFDDNTARNFFKEKKEQLRSEANLIYEEKIKAFECYINKKTSNKTIYKTWEKRGINSMKIAFDDFKMSCENRMLKWYNHHNSSHKWKLELLKAKTEVDAKAREVANNLLKEKELLSNGSFKYSNEECDVEFDRFWECIEKKLTSKKYFNFQKVDIEEQFKKEILEIYGNTPNFNKHMTHFSNKDPQETLLCNLKKTNRQQFKKRRQDVETLVNQTKSALLEDFDFEIVDGLKKFKIQKSEDFQCAIIIKDCLTKTSSLLSKINSSLIDPFDLSEEFKAIYSFYICQVLKPLLEKAQDYFFEYVDVKRKIVEGKKDTKTLFLMVLKQEGNLAITANQIFTVLLNAIFSNVIKNIPGTIKELFLKRVSLKEHIHGLVLLDIIDAVQNNSLTDLNIIYLKDYFRNPFDVFENKIRDILNACPNINVKKILKWELKLQMNNTELCIKNIVAKKETDLISQLCKQPHFIGLGIGKSDFCSIQMPSEDKREKEENDILKKLSLVICSYNFKFERMNATVNFLKHQAVNEIKNYLFGCKVTCPFCSAPCDNAHISQTLHSSKSHRPEGFGNFIWTKSNQFVLDICNETIKSSASFKNEATNGKYVKYANYKTVGDDYFCWDIKGMACEELSFWKYITYRIMPHIKMIFPSIEKVDLKQWSSIMKKEAVEAVVKRFHIENLARLENDRYVI
ncbi:interferon-induced very large GTPase 1 [Hydra vulgaris]|uniref:interferon-induced very large GTPase 1 n=1 Tax=Hydra vulgaris TaxID=6087 RepID=UPI001F5E3C4F|nr:interferon-induced very large GTPase 1 [Hydra vulgaris]